MRSSTVTNADADIDGSRPDPMGPTCPILMSWNSNTIGRSLSVDEGGVCCRLGFDISIGQNSPAGCGPGATGGSPASAEGAGPASGGGGTFADFVNQNSADAVDSHRRKGN